MPRIGRYHIFASDDDPAIVPDQIVLDQNVCIHIGKFYFGLTKEYNNDLQELLISFPYSKFFSKTHITSGWGIEENAWTRTGEFHPMRKRKFTWATEQVLNWEPARVRMEFAHPKSPSERDKDWAKGVPIPPKDRHPLMGVLMCYAPMLRLCSLFRETKRRGPDGGKWAFNQFIDWMMNSFGYLLSHEVALAAHALLAKGDARQVARGITHVGGQESPDELADKAWAAAWDMQYARLVDYGPMGIAQAGGRRFRKVAVVTEDDDSLIVNERAKHLQTIRGYSIYLMPSEIEIPPGEFTEDLGYGISLMRRTKPRNPNCDPLEALDTLERSLGVQRRTITAFRESPGSDASPSLLALLKELDERK